MIERPEDRPSRSSDGGPEHDVTWRELRRGLWVGRLEDHPLGVIEQGRRFTFTGADEQSHPGFATLSDAQDAATGSIGVIRPDREQPVARRRVGLPPGSVALLLLAGAVLVATCGLLLLL